MPDGRPGGSGFLLGKSGGRSSQTSPLQTASRRRGAPASRQWRGTRVQLNLEGLRHHPGDLAPPGPQCSVLQLPVLREHRCHHEGVPAHSLQGGGEGRCEYSGRRRRSRITVDRRKRSGAQSRPGPDTLEADRRLSEGRDRRRAVFDRITVDPRIMGGRACIRGMRIPVTVIVSQIAHGATFEEILQGYPDLERADIQQALEYAAWLAREDFTGAPAVTIEHDEQRALWSDLGTRWRIREQYFKAYPVCRWAQPAVEAVLDLQRMHRFQVDDIEEIAIDSFREAIALGSGRTIPTTTEDAQYSLPYAVAAVLAFERIGAQEVEAAALADPRVRRLLACMTLREDAEFSACFPAERWARATLRLNDGRLLRSEPSRARGNPENPLADGTLRAKYFDLATPVLGEARAMRIVRLVEALPHAGSVTPLLDELLRASV